MFSSFGEFSLSQKPTEEMSQHGKQGERILFEPFGRGSAHLTDSTSARCFDEGQGHHQSTLEKNPQDRYQRASELQAELIRVRGEIARRWRRRLAVAALAIVLFLQASAGGLVCSGPACAPLQFSPSRFFRWQTSPPIPSRIFCGWDDG